MMSSENIPPPSQPPDHNHSAASRKASAAPKTTQEPPQPPHPLKCPRCDSSNTKFCYYNNYSLTQPRHFCKTCRRYWTKGGALRNVPIGGGCRKTKKLKPSSSLSPSSYPTPSPSSSAAEFRFLAPPPAAALEFQLGGLSLPRLHPATAGVYTHFIASSGAHHHQPPLGVGPPTSGCFSLDFLGLGNYPPVPNSGNSSSTNSSLSLAGGGGGGGDHTLTISSIESLSTINQEMHWKLQQQRLALIYGPSSSGIEQYDDNNNQQEKTLVGGGIHLFKNLETTKKLDGVGGPTPAHAPTEWLFDQIQANSSSANSYGVTNVNNNNNTSVVGVNTCTTTSCNNNNSYEDFNGVWTTELHHHQFNGLQ